MSAPFAAAAAALVYSITASNVSLSDTGSGRSTYTVTSVGGFTGQIGVLCFAPEVDGSLVIPSCDVPEQFISLPANGSVSGKVRFTPPFSVTASNDRRGMQNPGGPLTVGALMFAGIAAARRRRSFHRPLSALVLGAALLAGLTGSGCAHGGLAMSHGTWSYTIQASGTTIKAASTAITVTVH